eukprot:1643586-Alexandrium_andersonii.AAC.1
MSASLVGSEMCIRDRFPPFDPVPDRVRASGRVGDPDYVALTTLHTKSVPVSYTHLTLPTICSV